MTATISTTESPAGKILAHLQRHGEAAVKELEDVLEVSTTAVREHLTHLQAKELVATRLVRRGPGRPHLVYFLTPKAQSQFPKQYDTLVNMLLREIAGQEGPERLQVILDAVGARLFWRRRGAVRLPLPGRRSGTRRHLRDGAPHGRAAPRRNDRP